MPKVYVADRGNPVCRVKGAMDFMAGRRRSAAATVMALILLLECPRGPRPLTEPHCRQFLGEGTMKFFGVGLSILMLCTVPTGGQELVRRAQKDKGGSPAVATLDCTADSRQCPEVVIAGISAARL